MERTAQIEAAAVQDYEQCYNAKLAVDRESRLIDLLQRFGPEPLGPPPPEPLAAMAHRLTIPDQ
ncbi:MAG: hypothetical protein HYY78_17840 [Betaproteobacteria bacterium]|nr:hypothetical protein [Betaproteobacteria bacterium]